MTKVFSFVFPGVSSVGRDLDGPQGMREACRTGILPDRTPVPEGAPPKELGDPGVSEDRLRIIVNEMIADVLKDEELRVHKVQVNQDPPRDLPENSHPVLPDVITLLSQGLNVWLQGPAGSGKSTIAEQAAAVLGLDAYPFTVGPADSPSKLRGFVSPTTGEYHGSQVRTAWEHGGVAIGDEMDNGHPSINTTSNDFLSDAQVVAFPDGPVRRHPDFRFVATANTYGLGADAVYVGRAVQDGAFLDRFAAVIDVDYDEHLETALTLAYANGPESESLIAQWLEDVRTVRKNVSAARLPIIVGQRCAIQGAKMIAGGMPIKRVAAYRLWRGMDADTVRQMMVGVTMALPS
jgi:hypothetical protein